MLGRTGYVGLRAWDSGGHSRAGPAHEALPRLHLGALHTLIALLPP